MSVSSTTWAKAEAAVLAVLWRVEDEEEEVVVAVVVLVVMSMLTLRWCSLSRLGWGWLQCFLPSWMLSLGMSGVRSFGKVMLAPEGDKDSCCCCCWDRRATWPGGLLPPGKGWLVEGERDSKGLLGVMAMPVVGVLSVSGLLGPWAIS